MMQTASFKRPRGPRSGRHMRGQALVEMAIAAAFVVPLFLLVPVIAKYGHARQMAQQAARNAAWEATVAGNRQLPAQGQLQAKVLDRNFARADEPIRTNRGGARSGEFGDEMLNTFSGKKLLERDNLQLRSITQKTAPGLVTGLVSRVPGAAPNPKGYVTAHVQLRLRNLMTRDGQAASYLQPFDSLNLVMDQKQVLVADTWDASGPTSGARSVKAQTVTFSPQGYVAPFGDMLNVIGALPIPIIGKLDDLDPGSIEPDIIPKDRLTRYPVNGP